MIVLMRKYSNILKHKKDKGLSFLLVQGVLAGWICYNK